MANFVLLRNTINQMEYVIENKWFDSFAKKKQWLKWVENDELLNWFSKFLAN